MMRRAAADGERSRLVSTQEGDVAANFYYAEGTNHVSPFAELQVRQTLEAGRWTRGVERLGKGRGSKLSAVLMGEKKHRVWREGEREEREAE